MLCFLTNKAIVAGAVPSSNFSQFYHNCPDSDRKTVVSRANYINALMGMGYSQATAKKAWQYIEKLNDLGVNDASH